METPGVDHRWVFIQGLFKVDVRKSILEEVKANVSSKVCLWKKQYLSYVINDLYGMISFYEIY